MLLLTSVRFRTLTAATAAILFASSAAHAAPIITWLTVGDPGNAPDTNTGSVYGSVAEPFRIMKYEFTNHLYADFLNSVAATDTYSLYNTNMGSDARGGITQSGAPGSYTYAVKANMGDKPVNYVSWFDAARVSNWLMNGATGTSSTETGAYTLNGATSGNAVATNPGATCHIPTEHQWYKAAYYKGGSTDAGYWAFATQSDTPPTAVTADPAGNGSAGSTGNYANYNYAASWNGQTGNLTTVGTNGGPSVYGAFDMSGNVLEWDDLDGMPGPTHGLRGGYYGLYTQPPLNLGSSDHYEGAPSLEYPGVGFRLAAPVAVPEPSTCVMAIAGLAYGGSVVFRRRRAR